MREDKPFDPDTVDDLETARAAFRWALGQLHELRSALEARKAEISKLRRELDSAERGQSSAEAAALRRAEERLLSEREQRERRLAAELEAALKLRFDRRADEARRLSDRAVAEAQARASAAEGAARSAELRHAAELERQKELHARELEAFRAGFQAADESRRAQIERLLAERLDVIDSLRRQFETRLAERRTES